MKNVVILAGTILLIAGCSNGLTSPTSPVRGGSAAVNAKSKQPTTGTGTNTATSQDNDAQGECRSGYSVVLGREDSVCMDESQQ